MGAVAVSAVLLLAGCAGALSTGARGLEETASAATPVASVAPALPSEQPSEAALPEPAVVTPFDGLLTASNKLSLSGNAATTTECPRWQDFVAQMDEMGGTALACGPDGWLHQYFYLSRPSYSDALLIYMPTYSGFRMFNNRPCANTNYANAAPRIRDLPWMQGYC